MSFNIVSMVVEIRLLLPSFVAIIDDTGIVIEFVYWVTYKIFKKFSN